MEPDMKTFPEEELHDLLLKIKQVKQKISKMKVQRLKLEREYKLKYNFIEWKKKEKKYFFIEGKEKDEIYYCHVIKVTEKEKQLEFIDAEGGYYSNEKIIDPLEEPGYVRWSEISREEYEQEKKGKLFAE